MMIREDILDGSKIPIGLSACLSGDEVRYNGQGAEDKFVTQQLSRFFDYVKVCPEISIGMGTPRETIRIVEDNGLKLKNREGSNDYTDKMNSFVNDSISKMASNNLCGFIFKKGSPSCGAFRVKVYNNEGVTQRHDENGFYAKAFKEKYPWLPVEEDGRLNDPALRHNFLTRVFSIRRWQLMVEGNPSIGGLVKFHQKHKYMLMSYSQDGLRELGRIVANKEGLDPETACSKYLQKFTILTSKPAPRSKHANVLYHMFGYFSRDLDEFDRHETIDVIEKYREGIIPLVLPVMRISQFVRKLKVRYLLGQAYLVYPEELGVLNKL